MKRENLTIEKKIQYKDLSFYLKSNLKAPSIDFKWTDEDNQKLLNFLEENAPIDYLTKDINISNIRYAFKKYFERVGYIIFEFENNKIDLQVRPYKAEPSESNDADKIVNIIEKYSNEIVKDYNDKKDQILLNKKLRDEIYKYVETIDNHQTNKKELIKFSVRQAFNLKESDIILVKLESIFIKLCDISKRKKIPSEKINTIENRYNGIDEEELESFVSEHLSNGEEKEFFELAAKLFVDRYLKEKNISNSEYEKNAFSYIQAIITEQLINKFDKCENFFKGLSGYMLRRHFIEVFENIAEAILVELSLSNPYIINFLKYYSLDIIVVDGQKYKVKAIETDNGLKWQVVSMMSIVKIYVKTGNDAKFLRNSIEKIESEMLQLSKDGYSPIEFNKFNTIEKNNLIDELNNLQERLEIYNDSKMLAKTQEEKESYDKEINHIKKQIAQTTKDKKEVLSKCISLKDINKYHLLEKELRKIKSKLRKGTEIINQNIESYNSIKNSLIKALISRKKLYVIK